MSFAHHYLHVVDHGIGFISELAGMSCCAVTSCSQILPAFIIFSSVPYRCNSDLLKNVTSAREYLASIDHVQERKR